MRGLTRNRKRAASGVDSELVRYSGGRESGSFDSYLGPDHLVPIDGQIKLVSAKVGDPDGSAYEQARAIYDCVIANMTYDKSGEGWGRGDAIRTLR